jgi:hypothetical protein
MHAIAVMEILSVGEQTVAESIRSKQRQYKAEVRNDYSMVLSVGLWTVRL